MKSIKGLIRFNFIHQILEAWLDLGLGLLNHKFVISALFQYSKAFNSLLFLCFRRGAEASLLLIRARNQKTHSGVGNVIEIFLQLFKVHGKDTLSGVGSAFEEVQLPSIELQDPVHRGTDVGQVGDQTAFHLNGHVAGLDWKFFGIHIKAGQEFNWLARLALGGCLIFLFDSRLGSCLGFGHTECLVLLYLGMLLNLFGIYVCFACYR